MKEQIAKIKAEALSALEKAADSAALDELRVKYLGKKGELTAVLKQMGSLSAEERPKMGQLVNEVKASLEAAVEAQSKKLEAAALEHRLKKEALDVTVPGKVPVMGHKHPMYIALDEIKEIFIGMGFTVLDGPEIELGELNFDRLNAEPGHPSRDWSDTFYFDTDERVMLRSQTSPMQVRAMDSMELPIRIIAPGRVYRKDEVDATHSPMFHQVEGMVIDKNVTMADLKGTLNLLAEELFGKGTVTRFRPHHFPFTEPS
ncbi:MAG: phenylalanine--tRNA ligase subunit alpha, partial [Oscillospiraceae bacterium]|nr:phenylalanine--tRNA ligase subunit alpha [Oscillospiraceae bacterium]